MKKSVKGVILLWVTFGTTLKTVQADLHRQAMMDSLAQDAQTLLTVLQDSYRAARSDAWQTFRAYYRVLNALAESDPKLRSQMKAIVEFMSTNNSKQTMTEEAEESPCEKSNE